MFISVLLTSTFHIYAVEDFPDVFHTEHHSAMRILSKDEFTTLLAELMARSEQGDIDAMHDIGWLYDPANRQSPEKNNHKAYAWYTKAAEKKHTLANRKVGEALLKKGDTESIKKGHTYLRNAATANDTTAQRILAEHLLQQNDIPSIKEAEELLIKAAEAHDPAALVLWADCIRKGVFSEPTPASLRHAFHLTSHAAELLYPPAMRRLYTLHHKGLGTHMDESIAIEWLNLAAELGDPEAQTELAYHYWNTSDITPNYEHIRRWLLSAVAGSKPMPRAAYLLGTLYENGLSVPQDRSEAIRWYATAARNGHYQSQLLMLHLAYQGVVGVFTYEQDLVKLQAGADSGNQLDQFLLGKFYETGFPKFKLEKNLIRAHHYYDMAAQQGLPAAIATVEKLSLQIQSKK
ncbi:MAG: SEL1-like repeat protein [Verrucomicrobiota bacterium]